MNLKKRYKKAQKKYMSIYDQNKKRVLKVAFQRYSLEELQEKLNIKSNEY